MLITTKTLTVRASSRNFGLAWKGAWYFHTLMAQCHALVGARGFLQVQEDPMSQQAVTLQ